MLISVPEYSFERDRYTMPCVLAAKVTTMSEVANLSSRMPADYVASRRSMTMRRTSA
jgi:hypothetical protein